MSCATADSSLNGFIDRIEGDFAVLVIEADGAFEQRDVPVSALPDGAREGDFLESGAVVPDARLSARERVRQLQRRLGFK